MVGAVTQHVGLVIHCVDGDIMARRGDSWATDACLPGHWRAVRERSMEKRQNHRVRPSVTFEAPLCCSLSFCPHRQSLNLFSVLFSRNSLSHSSELLCAVLSQCSQY